MPLNAVASGKTISIDASDLVIVSQYVYDMIPMYYEQSVYKDASISIGQRLSVFRLSEEGELTTSDYESYPLLINAQIAGIIDVYRNDNNEISQVSLGINYATELQELLDNNDDFSFAILYTQNGIFAKLSNTSQWSCLISYTEDNDYTINIEIKDLTYSSVTIQNEDANSILKSVIVPTQTRDVFYNALNVTNVSNASPSCCSSGICWAASIAIMANYHLGTSYTALQIHNIYGCLSSSYHSEEKSIIQQLGMYAGGPYYYYGSYPFNFSNLADCIDAYILLLLDLQDYNASVGHNVVSYGYFGTSNSTATYFYFMDPNTGSHLSSFPASSSDPVYISLGGYNYLVHCYITAS